MEEDIDYGTITCLPNEIILIILKNGSHTDIVRFGATCKRFYLLVNSNQYLWKEKCMTILPNDIYNIAQKHGQGQWLEELKRYFNVKEQVYEELASMSPKYYWRVKEIGLEDLSNFFSLALSHNQSYYYVLTILQDVIKRANTQNQNTCKKPFTLTDLYYARIILRYLTQTFLTVKWVQAHMMKTLQPEVVLNFFLQWTDTSEMHSDEEVNDALCEIQEDVEKLFPNDENVPYKNLYDKIHNGVLQERDVLMAISDVIYLNRRLAVMASANLDALNIVKAVKNKCGNAIAAAVVYTGVAARSGIECKLVAFPNHLFLEWKDPTDNRVYKIELDSGILMPKGRCPFSRSTNVEEYTYCPDSLLQFIVSSFLMTMGSLKNCETQNAVYLLDFLSTNPGEDNPYRHFLTYLLNYDHVPSLGLTLELKYLKTEHMDVIRGLSLLKSTQNAVVRESTIHNRDDTILYAVGMVCYHKKYDYVCVVKDWDLSCSAEWRRRIEFKTLSGGSQQPFYCVIAVDQSERYVAQENIVDVAHPSRLYHLEDVIAKEFSHFDGFSYIPNAEKSQEYPDDGRIRDYFKEIFEQKNFNQETDDSF